MHDVEKRELDATLAATMVIARVLERYEASASKKGGVRELEGLLSELRRSRKPFPESFAEWLAGKLGFKVDSRELENLREHLQAVDPLSLTDQASEACRVPLLSPLWILKLMREGKEGWQRYQELWRRSPSEEVKEEWRRLLEQELNEKIWLPVQPLSQELIELLDVLILREYRETTNNIRYEEVSRQLFQMLEVVSRFYCRLGSTRGLFETISSVFTSSLLFVPTWVNVRPPDAPLSTTSVLLGSLSALREGFTVVALDINGIQDFVFAPVKEAAASRLLRGRSLLVELVQFTASRLAIEMLGALAQFTKEGGSPTFIAPPLDAQALEKFSELLGKWMTSQFMARLWITVAASQKHNIKGALCPGEPLRVAFEELGSALAIEKSRKQAYAADWLRKLSERRLKGLDALTREPVLEDDPWALDVSQTIDYADELAPGKLERGDLLSGLTHISLACGNVARNLVAIVSIYLFKEGEPYDRDARIVAEKLARSLSEAGRERLYAPRSKVEGLDAALVPFCEVGAIHLLASLHEPELGRLQRSKVVTALLNHVLKNMRGVKLESDYVHFEVRAVNAPYDFLLTEELVEELKSLGPRVGVSMLPFYTNTYHPVKFEDGKPRLVDLDEMRTIAVAFLDADGVGETTEKLSKLPIALASFSDFLSLGFGAKAYACLLKKVANAGDEKPKSIILYAGGDDVSVYGAWYDVIGLLGDISEEVLGDFLNPLTASGGISLADNKTPILYLAEVARDAERKAKRKRKRRAEGGLIHIQELTTEPLKLRGGPLDLPKLACCLEEKKVKDLRDFKLLIYALAELADEASKLVAKQEELNKLNEKERERIIIAKAKLVVGYKYLIARRHEDFENLKDKLRDVEIQLPSLDSNQDEVIRGLTTLKPLLDLLALRLREQ
jgi:CRISPR-associated protein Csm1